MRLRGGKWRTVVSIGRDWKRRVLAYRSVSSGPQPFVIVVPSIVDKNRTHVLTIHFPIRAVEFVDVLSLKLMLLERH